jgi:superfamily II DNA/RNA helicase
LLSNGSTCCAPYIESGKLDVSGVRFFVLDEADRLLDTGNQAAILKLFDRMPKSGPGFSRLQVLLFSATLHSPEILSLAGRLTQNATWVDLKVGRVVVSLLGVRLVRLSSTGNLTAK